MRCYSIILFFMLIAICNSIFADHGREIRPKSWQQDATINDVFSINENLAWAVGDQGVILRTTDGGDTWIPSEGVGLDLDNNRSLEDKLGKMRPISRTHELYPLTCSFHSVFFLNENRGWVVGSYHTPYLGNSRSVMLTTNDGGKSWQQFKTNLLPHVSRIYFQDLLGGWAIGNAGNLYRSGVFATSTGGQMWSVQDVKPARNWIDGELIPNGFVVIDDDGIIGRIIGKRFEPAVVFGKRPGKLKSVRMLNTKIGWAVGHNGTVLQTRDSGQTWKRPESFYGDNNLLSEFDFSTVFVREGRVWIAGNPGTTIVSFDARSGDDLDIQLTGSSIPISKLNFASKDRGWAVGANGMIMSTADGGSNWRHQRDSTSQTALMIVSLDATHLPFGLISYYSNEKNYLSATVLLGRNPSIERSLAQVAVNRIGCSTCLELLGDDLSSDGTERNGAATLNELARTIRTMKPNVLVCNQVPGLSDNELHVLCRTAIDMAANSSSLEIQIDEMALEPWQVDRYLIRQAKPSDINLKGSRYLPKSGKLLEDHVAFSRALAGLPIRMLQEEHYRVESFTGTVSSRLDNAFYGLKQLGKFVPQRESMYRMGNLNSIATAPLKNQEFRRLMALGYETNDEKAELHAQIQRFATGIEADQTGIWMVQLADLFLDRGNFDAAAFTLEEMVSRYKDHLLAPSVLMWLAQYYSSEEVIEVLKKNSIEEPVEKAAYLDEELYGDVQSKFISSAPIAKNENGVRLVNWEVDETVEPVREVVYAVDHDEKTMKAIHEFRMKKANRFLAMLKQHDLDFAQSDRMQFMEAMVLDKTTGDVSNGNLLKSIKRQARPDSDFLFAANQELRARSNSHLVEHMTCFQIKQRPLLDGSLEDEIWQNAMAEGNAAFKSVKLRNETKSSRNDVCWLAHDEKFIYFAARCNKVVHNQYSKDHQTRERDTDLSQFDRIRLRLDLDRDLQSEFCFEVDYRGWANDSCAGAKGWNPEWYIAVGEDEKAWTIEAAIPLSELTDSPAEELGLAAVSFARLDTYGTNIWSQRSERRPKRHDVGLTAGLRITPTDFELLKFTASEVEVDK